MGGGVSVAASRSKGITLNRLLFRYLLAVAASLLLVLASGALVFLLVIGTGGVLPANIAERGAEQWETSLAEGTAAPEALPYYYRWICLDDSGNVTAHSGLSQGQQAKLQAAAQSREPMVSGFPYSFYQRYVQLPDGRLCAFQYNFSMPYTSPWLFRHLPDLQILVVLWMTIAGMAALILCTRRFARRLRRDIQVLTAAAQTIAKRDLEAPLETGARVRELRQALESMELLRQNLSQSLQAQWAMEQQRQRELSALAHDLKTPLTIAGGNAELLAEEALSEAQKKNVDAILRSTQRMEAYLGQLRSVAAGEHTPGQQETVELGPLYEQWKAAAEALCRPKSIELCAQEPPKERCVLDSEQVSRAVLNLLDNAVRFTKDTVTLSAQIQDGNLVVEVSDNGPGFSREALAHAGYALYTQDAHRPSQGHMGMGLCFARQTARDHGGSLEIQNREQGAAVRMILPIREAAN